MAVMENVTVVAMFIAILSTIIALFMSTFSTLNKVNTRLERLEEAVRADKEVSFDEN